MFSQVDLTLAPSRTGRCWLLLVHVLALSAIWLTSLPVFTRVVLTLIVLIAFFVSRLSLIEPVRRIRWQLMEGQMQIETDQQRLNVERLESILVTRRFVFMRVHLTERLLPLPLVVWRDAVSEQGFRRFSVAVRLAKPPGSLRKQTGAAAE